MVSGKVLVAVLGVAIAATLSGCASNGPTQVGFAGGSDCKSTRAELNRLDAQGVPGKIEAQQSGRKVSAESAAQISRYNGLLEQYLGNQCQLPPG